jgi:Fe(3+) dicitrate transport protein
MRSRLSFVLLLLAIFMQHSVFGQRQLVSFSGKVADETGVVLKGIHIALEGTGNSGVTDHDGRFVLENVKPGRYVLTASGIGFQTLKETVTVSTDSESLMLKMKVQSYPVPTVEILASNDRLFSSVPGSLSLIPARQIQNIQPVSGNEIMRQAPGLNVVDEEGLGLRTNIGIRGLDPDRSRTVLMLEDGVPVALAPYGEPEMYYTPAIERMSGVEVLKGSGSILYGPQTIGGVINYQTIDPPQKPEGFFKTAVGDNGYFTGMLGYGTSFGKTGIQVNYLRKQADEFGATFLRLNDLTSKIVFQISDKSALGIKMGLYNETSNSTYIGLTQPMYDQGDNDFTQLAPNDRLNIRRYSLSLSHNYQIRKNLRVVTTAYGYTTTRDWMRQDFSYSSFDDDGNPTPLPSNYSGVTWGDSTVDGGAIYMRNSTGNRNRRFEVAGVEPRLFYEFKTGSVAHQFTGGVRLLVERAYEQRINGSKADAISGTITEDEIRTGYGYSAFVHDKLQLTKSLSFTAGVRMEYFDYERDIRRGRFEINGTTATRDTLLVSGSNVLGIIPGAGFNVSITSNLNLFAGVHRGFAPPRVKDAISSEGEAYELDAELSWNYEAGIRSEPFNWLQIELTGFHMDFENQVIPVSESSGGTGSGLVNGGRTHHTGFEAGVNINTREFKATGYHAELRAGMSYVKSVFAADRYIGGTDNRQNIKSNFTPYAPEWNANGTLSIHSPFGLSLILTGNYVSDQFTDEINSTLPSNDGRTGLIEAHYTFDTGVKFTAGKINSVFSLCLKNVTDERYITSRRPQGIRVGLPRMLFGGVKVNF